MSHNRERFKGKAEEVAGSIKKTVGKVIGNEQMEAEGKAKELKGEARQEAAKAAERLKGHGEQIKGTVKEKLGDVLDDEQMEAEGKAKRLEGEARVDVNK